MAKSVRQSNIELLRIIAMTFIVIGHIVSHGTHNSLPGSEVIKVVTITGVDLFVMISGYFGIRLSFRALFNIIGIVLFYSLLSIALSMLVFNQSFAATKVLGAFFPMSLSGAYWFVSCYLILMLLSPAINIVLDKTTNLQYIGILAIVAYISCVSGWFFRNQINPHGYTSFNMVFIYLVGHGIRRFSLSEIIKPISWFMLVYCVYYYFIFNATIFFSDQDYAL